MTPLLVVAMIVVGALIVIATRFTIQLLLAGSRRCVCCETCGVRVLKSKAKAVHVHGYSHLSSRYLTRYEFYCSQHAPAYDESVLGEFFARFRVDRQGVPRGFVPEKRAYDAELLVCLMSAKIKAFEEVADLEAVYEGLNPAYVAKVKKSEKNPVPSAARTHSGYR